MRATYRLLMAFGLAYVGVLVFAGTGAQAQWPPCYDAAGQVTACEGAGGIRHNGSNTQPADIRPQDQVAAGVPSNWFPALAPAFLFEPESPYDSLRSVPTWNELEQMLDNPYAVAVDPTTPGNFDGWPSYRSTIVRRPNITAGSSLLVPGAPLPGFITHPLNYNPTDGEEMRLLNAAFSGGPWTT